MYDQKPAVETLPKVLQLADMDKKVDIIKMIMVVKKNIPIMNEQMWKLSKVEITKKLKQIRR